MKELQFVIGNSATNKRNVIELRENNWNDYGFYTSCDVYYYDEKSNKIVLGLLKIGKKGFNIGKHILKDLPNSFSSIPEDYFSLWQSAESYMEVKELESITGANIFYLLRDLANDLNLLDKYRNERVVVDSLLRYVNAYTCRNQFHRICEGNGKYKSFNFSFVLNDDNEDKQEIDFSVNYESLIPTNIHALIGSNGTGKTSLLKKKAISIVDRIKTSEENDNYQDNRNLFEGVVYISFSPFDNYSDFKDGEHLTYIGIGRDGDYDISKGLHNELSDKFKKSVEECLANLTKKQDLFEILDCFIEQVSYYPDVKCLIDYIKEYNLSEDYNGNEIWDLFEGLSSGFKVALSIITRCISKLQEKTVVMIDEPENHLHPPLLSALIRSISKVLVKRNSVAIISTHSPIVLQEIPSSCVWILERYGSVRKARRPSIETFGTGIGSLMTEVFCYEIYHTGFLKIVRETVNECSSFEEVLSKFNGKLGNEAKSYARSLMLSKNEKD